VLTASEFSSTPTLTLSEAKFLLDAVLRDRSERSGKVAGEEVAVSEYEELQWRVLKERIMRKTREYLDVFARFKNEESVQAVERILRASGLEEFENAQLGK